MKKLLLILLLSCPMLILTARAQSADAKAKRTYSTYYYQRASLFEVLPTSAKDIIFLGNSITDGAEWNELMGNRHAKNRGISGDTTWGVYDRLETILKGHPQKIFLLIGINDIGQEKDDQYVIDGIQRIVKRIRTEAPKTQLYVQSLLPVNPAYGKFTGHTSQWQRIPGINAAIQQMAQREGATYIDLFQAFVDHEGKMKKEYTNDGLHLLGKGYLLWKSVIGNYMK